MKFAIFGFLALCALGQSVAVDPRVEEPNMTLEAEAFANGPPDSITVPTPTGYDRPADELHALLRRELPGPVAAVPATMTLLQARWERIDGISLRDWLHGARLDDAAAAYPDSPGGAFLGKSRYLEEYNDDEWDEGTYRVVGDRYCTHMPGKRERCFALAKADGYGVLRVELGRVPAEPTLISVLPASRGAFTYRVRRR